MKISVVTVSYNSSKTISDTIRSVNSQDYSDVEHIFVDGGSDDGTSDIIKSQSKRLGGFVSEKDSGIYDAMNKGISFAKGDIIGTLNADDIYADESVLTWVADAFSDQTLDACYGDLLYVKEKNIEKTVRYWKSMEYKDKLFKKGWMPAHPTFFVRKRVYEKFGTFNLRYDIAADFELTFRLIEVNKIKVKYLPHVLVKMRLGGTTNKSMTNILKQNKEIFSILKKHYKNFSLIRFFFEKLLNRTAQFIKRPSKRIRS